MTDEIEKPEKTEAEAQADATPVTEEAKPKPARKPRAAAKPKADTTEAAATAAEKPKRTRTARSKPEAAKAEAPKAEAPGAEAAKPAKAAPKKAEPKAEAAKAEKPARAAPKKAEPKKPALRSRAARREHQEPVAAPVVRAQAKYVRSSARKARLVCDNIRGKSVDDARAILAHTPRAVARDWSKLLESAVANAEHNHELVGEDLVIKAVTADEGPTIKRFRPRAMGRATKIRKRTAHLTILLTPKN
jgi:large subunit ribosomal protein L22